MNKKILMSGIKKRRNIRNSRWSAVYDKKRI